ncbi:MAG TPA: FAD-linked oxidase C-terminal domain-containing protein, partial [Longimicrobiales bacterium]
RFTEEGAHLVVKYGGSLSGEHGDGQSRADLLPIMFGSELVDAFRELKRIWDPTGMMNPGKVVNPYPRTSNLRLGTDYRPANPETHFQYPEDEGSFSRATLRCVGVGECRRHEGGTMCPSYQVTREEKHSTRGRAHLLNEMLRGETLADGWKNEEVKEALDLCLACKGCKGDCPVNVDMATYKAEFLSHYYEGRLRPRHAYAIGLIHWWARLARLAPEIANFLTHAPGLARLGKAMAGVTQEREVPRFAVRSFQQWWRRRPRRHAPGFNGRVVLWADTFNDNFFPSTLAAAVEVLEAGGFEVVVPRAGLCCGRPLYDFGMLEQAKKQLRQILDALRPEIERGTPVVGLEPSCVSVFRDELPNLLAHDQDARRLRDQVFTLAEFVAQHPDEFDFAPLEGKALVHGHCHDRAVMRMKGYDATLEQLGLEHETLKDTCCGLAGAFGFEAEHYDVSMAVGEHSLLPAVRAADEDTFILSDGFSCREQIAHATERRALHLAELLQLTLHGEGHRIGGPRERAAQRLQPPELADPGVSTGTKLIAASAGAAALGAGL